MNSYIKQFAQNILKKKTMPHHGHEHRKAEDLAKEQNRFRKTDIGNILKETGLGAKDLEKKHFANFPTLEESIKEKQIKK